MSKQGRGKTAASKVRTASSHLQPGSSHSQSGSSHSQSGSSYSPPGSSRSQIGLDWKWVLAFAGVAAVLGAVWVRNPAGPEHPGPAPAEAQTIPVPAPAEGHTPPVPDAVVPATTTPGWTLPDLTEDQLPIPAYVASYPKPGDPEYADYQEMLRQPEYRTSVDTAPGFQGLPYDPEWRSLVTGRREVARHDLGLTPGSTSSVEDLAEQWVTGVRNLDESMLAETQVTRAEFLKILWPEFPQSRPYVRIPPDEAWFLQLAKMSEGRRETLGDFGHRNLRMESVRVASVKEYTNFRILDVHITAQDEDSGESLEITGPEGGSVLECRGRYKIYFHRN